MRLGKYIRILLLMGIVIVNIGCDQLSKKIVREKIEPDASITAFQNHFTLTRVENSGAFLSVGDTLPKNIKDIVLSYIPVLVITFVMGLVFLKQNMGYLNAIGLCFIAGGGIGNIYDRIMRGSVTDFLHIDFGLFQTGIFNLADVSICFGTVLLIFHAAFYRK